MNYAVEQKTRLHLTDGRWLLVAVVVHALIFAIPLKDLPTTDLWHSAELVVRLISVQPRAEPDSFDDEPVRVETPIWPRILKKVEIPRRETGILEKPVSPETLPEEEASELDDQKSVTATRLLGMRSELTERVPLNPESQTERYRLGSPRLEDEPTNWQPYVGAESLAPFDNTFNGMNVPSDTVVIDSWREPGGSYGVILETPSGHRLCGRKPPWDPMRPMIEPLAQFHVCGGDFAVPFKFKPREPLNRDFIDPVAKDAIQLPVSPD